MTIVDRAIINPIRELAENGKLTGIMLIGATIISLTFSNSDYGASYLKIWNTEIGVSILHNSILHWINDGLMAVFFLLAGLEIRREILHGELSDRKQAVLPVVAALGGILVPALFYFLFNRSSAENIHGWAIPTATDIAFSLGIISLLGQRVPFALKIFLTALAIIDDLAAILIIAFFYTTTLQYTMIILAATVFVILLVMGRMKSVKLGYFIIPGLALWYFILKSGIHPTVAGVLFAFVIPVSLLENLEHRLNKTVNYMILPLFALANTAMAVSFEQAENLLSPLSLGIIAGLFVGKPAGITLATLFAVGLKFARLPEGIGRGHVIGLGLIAGIGFTMSIFIASLSFSQESTLTLAKLSVLTGSFLSAAAGLIVLWITIRKKSIE